MKCFTFVFKIIFLFAITQQKLHAFETRIERRAAFDIGSGKTKILIADVDIDNYKIIQTIHSEFVRLKFAEDLAINQSGSFSKSIQMQAIKEICALKEKAQLLGAKHFSGVATEAFRCATNGQEFLDFLKKELNLPFHTISQHEEASLGFRTLAAYAKISINSLIALDHGSGSFQVSAENDGDILSYNGQWGTVALTKTLLSLQGKSYETTVSLNPVSLDDAHCFLNYILNSLPAPSTWLQNKINQDNAFIGGLSGPSGTFGLCAYLMQNTNFSRDNLWKTILNLLNTDDFELKNRVPEISIQTVLPRLLFAYSLMTKLNIQEINWFEAKSGLAAGVLLTPYLWSCQTFATDE